MRAPKAAGRERPADHAGRRRSTGTASRSRSCSPRRRSRPTTPRRWFASTYDAEPAVDRRSRPPRRRRSRPTACSASRRCSRSATPRRRSPRRRSRVDVTYHDAAPQPQRHRAARGDGRLGRRRADRARRHADACTRTAWHARRRCSGSTSRQVRVTVAVRRRRVRRQGRSGATSPRRGRGAGWPAGRCGMMLSREGVYRIVGGRTPTEQRVALGAQRGRHARRR